MNLHDTKIEMRRKFKKMRDELDEATRADFNRKIFYYVTNLNEYKDCQVLFTYVSVKNEVDTIKIIEHALSCGKTVAVPKTIPERHEMEFYCIHSLNDLQPSKFGLLEPDLKKCKRTGFYSGFCIIPGLSFDKNGGRLGYGGGYYDRFLVRFRGVMTGLCYSNLFSNEILPQGRFDIAVDYVVTDKIVFKTV